MKRLLCHAIRRIAAFMPDEMRREDGTAAMEFVLVVPVIMMIFMASFESGLMMVRSIMLEQSVDMTMRELRLGHFSNVTNRLLKREICARTVVFPDCMANIKIQLDRVSTEDWNMPATPRKCIDRRAAGEPVEVMNPGQQNDLMIVRVCVAQQAMFPTSGIALKLPLDQGAYGLVTRTAYSVEPK